jgi:hypothetical protein
MKKKQISRITAVNVVNDAPNILVLRKAYLRRRKNLRGWKFNTFVGKLLVFLKKKSRCEILLMNFDFYRDIEKEKAAEKLAKKLKKGKNMRTPRLR